MPTELENEVNQLHAEICSGLADPTRIMIIYLLAQHPCHVTEICSSLNMSQPMVSRHLKVLRERGMAIANRQGNLMVYSLSDRRLVEALDLLRAVMHDTVARRAAMVNAVSGPVQE